MSHKHLAYSFARTLTEHDLDAFAALLHADYVNHNAFAAPGKAGSVSVFADFLRGSELRSRASTKTATP